MLDINYRTGGVLLQCRRGDDDYCRVQHSESAASGAEQSRVAPEPLCGAVGRWWAVRYFGSNDVQERFAMLIIGQVLR